MTHPQEPSTSTPAAGSPQEMSRRKFLKLTAAALGAGVLTCSGLGYLAARQPGIDLAEITCQGETKMKQKTLVTYATRSGSTGEIAEAIGRVLCQQGASVDVRPVKEVKSLDGYGAVVIGSAIRMGNWLPEAVKFVEQHQAELQGKPLAYFVASLFLVDGDPAHLQEVATYLDKPSAIVEPAKTGLFPGKLDMKKLSFLEKQMAKMVKSPEGDFRDWQAIDAWAHDLAASGFAG